MRVFGLRWLVLAAVVWSPASGAQGPGPSLRFTLDRQGAAALAYTVTVSENGDGVYQPGLPPVAGAPATALLVSPKKLHIAPALVKRVFAAVPIVEGGRCETHSKGIAQTGAKTLHFQGVAREAECSYNYSDEERVNEATAAFEGLAETMTFGEKLQAKLRFDRLGLDGDLEQLQNEVAGGRALEVGNIAPVLNSIAADDRVMEVARRRAERLLAASGAVQAPTAAEGASAP